MYYGQDDDIVYIQQTELTFDRNKKKRLSEPQGAYPPPPLSVAKASRNNFNEWDPPPPPPPHWDRRAMYIATMSNLC